MAALSAGDERALQVAGERVVGGRDAPLGQSVRRHRRQVALPGRIGRRAHFEIREVGCAGQNVKRDLALLHAALQVVHHQRGLVHVFDVELRLRAGDLQAQVEPLVLRDVDRAGEPGPVVDLPVDAGVENRRVLHGVGKAGLVRAEINPLACWRRRWRCETEAEEAALGGSGDVHVDDAVAHLKILHDGRAAIEAEALAALVLGDFGFTLQLPARRVGRKRERLRLRQRRQRDQQEPCRQDA